MAQLQMNSSRGQVAFLIALCVALGCFHSPAYCEGRSIYFVKDGLSMSVSGVGKYNPVGWTWTADVQHFTGLPVGADLGARIAFANELGRERGYTGLGVWGFNLGVVSALRLGDYIEVPLRVGWEIDNFYTQYMSTCDWSYVECPGKVDIEDSWKSGIYIAPAVKLLLPLRGISFFLGLEFIFVEAFSSVQLDAHEMEDGFSIPSSHYGLFVKFGMLGSFNR